MPLLAACLAIAWGERSNAGATGVPPAEELLGTVQAIDFSVYVTDPDSLADRVRTEEAALQRLVEAAASPHEQATAELALANWWLGIPTSGAAQRWVLGLHSEADLRQIAEAAGTARAIIRRAKDILDDPTARLSDESRTRLAGAADTLERFAELLEAMSRPTSKEQAEACIRAARRLGVVRESPDPETAAAALLWQSFGWERAGNRERALVSLPECLKTPVRLPYDFFARLLRCRLRVEEGEFAVGAALAARMRGRCATWFADGAVPEDGARQLAAVLQGHIIQAWLRDAPPEDEQAQTRLARLALGLTENVLGPAEQVTVCRLQPAVPIIVMPPITETSTNPGDDDTDATPRVKTTLPSGDR